MESKRGDFNCLMQILDLLLGMHFDAAVVFVIKLILILRLALAISGVSSLGVPGMPWHPQILADQLTLSQPGEGGGADYSHPIIHAPPDFQTFLWPCFCIVYYRSLTLKSQFQLQM
jgi:hypothetical protein